MKKFHYFILIFIICSCNMSRQYANYRIGGKTEKTNTVISNDSLHEITSSEPEIKIKEIKNQDSLILSKRKMKEEPKIVAREKSNQYQNSIPKKDTSYVMDDELVSAYSAAAFNGLAGLFGFLTLVSPNAIWFAAPLYIGSIVFSFIGIICFFVSLAKFSQGKLDQRNKKYYLLWFVVFGLSVLLALVPLLMII